MCFLPSASLLWGGISIFCHLSLIFLPPSFRVVHIFLDSSALLTLSFASIFSLSVTGLLCHFLNSVWHKAEGPNFKKSLLPVLSFLGCVFSLYLKVITIPRSARFFSCDTSWELYSVVFPFKLNFVKEIKFLSRFILCADLQFFTTCWKFCPALMLCLLICQASVTMCMGGGVYLWGLFWSIYQFVYPGTRPS